MIKFNTNDLIDNKQQNLKTIKNNGSKIISQINRINLNYENYDYLTNIIDSLNDDKIIFVNFIRFKRSLILNIINTYQISICQIGQGFNQYAFLSNDGSVQIKFNLKDTQKLILDQKVINISCGIKLALQKQNLEINLIEIKNEYKNNLKIISDFKLNKLIIRNTTLKILKISSSLTHQAVLTLDNNLIFPMKNMFGESDTSRIHKSKSIKDISCGYCKTCIIQDDRSIQFIGLIGDINREQHFTHKSVIKVALGSLHYAILFDDGSVEFIGDFDLGFSGVDIILNTKKQAVQIACGCNHTAVLYSDGSLNIAGINTYGQCNSSNLIKQKKIIQIFCGNYNTLVIQSDGIYDVIGNQDISIDDD